MRCDTLKKLLILVFAFSFFVARPQFKQDTSRKVNLLVLPLVFRSPETLWAGGVSSSISFRTTHPHDTLTRISSIQALALFTQREQNIQAIDATIYFPKEKYVFYLQSSHSYFPDKYWGIGPNTKENFEQYKYQQLYVRAHVKRKIRKKIFAGLLYEYQKIYNVRYGDGGLYDTTATIGKNGYHVSGFGGSIGYDTRNSTFWPTKGVFLQTLITFFNSGLGSDYNNLKTIIDFRFFKKVFKDHVVAGQIYSHSNRGDAAIRELALIGGLGNLRGFYQGRFRDNAMLTAIAEYRAPIYGRLAVCAFIGGGNVYSEFSELKNIYKNFKYSWGGGIRFAVLKKEKLNLRLDYGYYDKYNHGVYFTIGECF